MYSLDYDPDLKMVIANLRGFWDVPTVDRYSADIFRLYDEVRKTEPFFRVLCRSGGMKVQAKEVAEAFAKFGRESLKHCPGPVAITVASILNKLQVAHSFPLPGTRIFMDEAEARSWLMSIGPDDVLSIETDNQDIDPAINYI